MALVLRHATKTQLIARLRERYQAAEREEVWRLAAFLLAQYQAGDFTALQLRTAFGMTAAQFTAFADRVQVLAAKWADLKASTGE
jgi:hypothetical protein